MGSLSATRPAARQLALEPGRVIGLYGPPGSGLTRVGLSLLAQPSRQGPVAFLDTKGWLCPLAAWESGVTREHFVVVRCSDQGVWPKVMAALLEGVRAVYAEIPAGVGDAVLRRLGALARTRKRAVMFRPLADKLPPGLAHLALMASGVAWEGADAGHGRIVSRRLVLEASGKGVGGIPTLIELEDDGADALRMVSRLGAASVKRAAG